MVKPPKARSFEFTSFLFKPEEKLASFSYTIKFDNRRPMVFKEEIIFPKKIAAKKIPEALLKEALHGVHLMLGISYYKLYCPPKIELNQPISKEQAEFWNTVYQKGLGEFFYQNRIDPTGLINFPFKKFFKKQPYPLPAKERTLLGIGGGKESIVAGELLKQYQKEVAGFVLETQRGSLISQAVATELGFPSCRVKRLLDEKIFDKHEGAYNGHIPISAVFAFVGYLVAILYDYSQIIVGNEYSSNFGNVRYKGQLVNHQWSKSIEFEGIFQSYCRKFLCPNITYFSLLRPLYELRIAQMFATHKKYFSYFSSCNRNFKVHKERQSQLWCGQCAKCVFTFILLSAFLEKKEVVRIFGKNLYEEEALLSMFEGVLGFGKMKPFDCVGTFQEAQAALFLARKKFRDSFIVKTLLPKVRQPEKSVEEALSFQAAETLPDNFKLLLARRVLIVGYGKEGKVSKKYISRYFPSVKIGIADQKKDPRYLEKQKGYDLAIKTPGLPKRHMTIPYITATNLFFSQVKNITIGVTGSKGKSTTASLIYAILKAAGKKATLLGNIGNPMLEVLTSPIDPAEIFVLELSSYQLDDIKYAPNIAVALNFFPEHMNYHGDVEKYYEAKKNITRFQQPKDYFVYNEKDIVAKNSLKETIAKKIPFNGNVDLKNIRIPLRGKHNEDNIKAAIAVARLLDIPSVSIKKAIEGFRPLPHRLELVGEFKGITFYDDAISTTPESTIMALKAIPGVETLFLGGEDRGYDFAELEKEIRRCKIKNIVLFPESGKRILKRKEGFRILSTSSMKEAVEFAYKNTSIGSVCLLSTASPSYSVWKNFEEKGRQFQYFVRQLSKK